jgi:hypothetical protein
LLCHAAGADQLKEKLAQHRACILLCLQQLCCSSLSCHVSRCAAGAELFYGEAGNQAVSLFFMLHLLLSYCCLL